MKYNSQLKDIFYTFLISVPLMVYVALTIFNDSKSMNFGLMSGKNAEIINAGNLNMYDKHKNRSNTTIKNLSGRITPTKQDLFSYGLPEFNAGNTVQNVPTGYNHNENTYNTINEKRDKKTYRGMFIAENTMSPVFSNRRNSMAENGNTPFGSITPNSLYTENASTKFLSGNSTTGEDDFDPGAGTDPDGTYNDAPLGDGTAFLFLLSMLYVVFKKRKKIWIYIKYISKYLLQTAKVYFNKLLKLVLMGCQVLKLLFETGLIEQNNYQPTIEKLKK